MIKRVPESVLKQDLGPAKYQARVEKQNKEYDKKVGTRDPKTGAMYHKIDFTDPRKSKISSGLSIGGFLCEAEGCSNSMPVNRNTASIQCSNCKTGYFVTVDRLTEEFTVKKFG